MSGDMLFPGKQRLATVTLHRIGTPVEVLRPDGTASENKYNKVSDTDVSWTEVEDSFAYRMYPYKDSLPNEAGALGGRVDSDSPFVAMPRDTDAQEGDRLVFKDNGNEEYALDEQIPRKTHYEFRTTVVND